jgi:hypothetical protein
LKNDDIIGIVIGIGYRSHWADSLNMRPFFSNRAGLTAHRAQYHNASAQLPQLQVSTSVGATFQLSMSMVILGITGSSLESSRQMLNDKTMINRWLYTAFLSIYYIDILYRQPTSYVFSIWQKPRIERFVKTSHK